MNTKEDFKNLVKELLTSPSESRSDEIMEKLDVISPDSEFSDYIFYSQEFELADGNFDIDGLADKVFSYKAIQL